MRAFLFGTWVALAVALLGAALSCSKEETAPAADASADAPALRDVAGDTSPGVEVVQDAGEVAAEDPGAPSEPGITWTVAPEPLALELSHPESELPALAAEGLPAFFVSKGYGRIELEGRAKVVEAPGLTVVTALTTDGRAANLRIEAGPEGAVALHFTVEGLREAETLGVRLKVGAEEGFYGLMERVVAGSQGSSWEPGMSEGLDLRGQTVPLYVQPTVSVYSPFFVSSAGYGVHVDSDWPGKYRFGVDRDGEPAPEELTIEQEGPELWVRVIPGPTPLEASARYARSVGTSLLPPRWVFGHWRWRNDIWDLPAFYDGAPYDGPYNSMVVEDILMMEALGIPCSLYWIDRPWAKGDFGYDDLEWDAERIPDPTGMIDWLAARDIHFMLWLAPWAWGPKMKPEAVALGCKVSAFAWQDDGVFLDLTKEECVTWWQDALIERIEEGVVGFKLDRGEEMNPDGKLLKGSYGDGTTYREGHNRYPEWYAAAVHGAFERAGVEEYVVMPRAGWVGTSQHAVVWGGDTGTSQWGLRSAIIAVQRAAVMNFPVWGSDTCGYANPTSHEVCTRWLQFSAFTPLMEVGPTGNVGLWAVNEDGEGAAVGAGGYGYEPVWNRELIATWILYANLHQDLQDYSYEQAKLAHEEGTPIVRPMIMQFPDRPEYRELFDQYLYGPDLLVAPIWKTGTTSREVHIPDGEWVDAWTGEAMAPVAVVTVDTPAWKIPIYVRKGSGIDLGDLPARWEAALAKAKTPPDMGSLVEAAGL